MKRIFIISLLGFFFLSGFSQSKDTNLIDSIELQVDTSLDVQKLYKLGNKYLRKRRFADAEKVFDACIVKEPVNIEFYASKAFALFYQHKCIECIKLCDIVLQTLPTYGEIYNIRGICKYDLGDSDGACKDWHKAYSYGLDSSWNWIKRFCND